MTYEPAPDDRTNRGRGRRVAGCGRSWSSIQNTDIIARVQAIACRRERVTSASYFDERMRTTFDACSYSSNTRISRARNALRLAAGRVSMWARIKAPIMVSSGEGGGSSSLSDGGIDRVSIRRTPMTRTPMCKIIERRNVAVGNTATDHVPVYPVDCFTIVAGSYIILLAGLEALARLRSAFLRPVPVGAGRVDQVRNSFFHSSNTATGAAFQRGSA